MSFTSTAEIVTRRLEIPHTDVFVSEIDEIVEEAVAVVTALLRPIYARAVDDVAVHDRRRNVR